MYHNGAGCYLAWLQAEALAAGCRLVRRRICGTLAGQEQPLLGDFAADAIINCSGLGSAELAADAALDPHRGALLRLVNDGRERPRAANLAERFLISDAA